MAEVERNKLFQALHFVLLLKLGEV